MHIKARIIVIKLLGIRKTHHVTRSDTSELFHIHLFMLADQCSEQRDTDTGCRDHGYQLLERIFDCPINGHPTDHDDSSRICSAD
jgi:hypothetical protein